MDNSGSACGVNNKYINSSATNYSVTIIEEYHYYAQDTKY